MFRIEEGGGAGLLGSCWLVVAAMTEVVTVAPVSVMITMGFEGIPVPIVFALALVASLGLAAVYGREVPQSIAAYAFVIWTAYSLAVPPPVPQATVVDGVKVEKKTTELKMSAADRTW